MKKTTFLLIALLTCSLSFSQTIDSVGVDSTKKTFTVVETYPEFPGGDEAWFSYLDKNLTYPMEARKQKISGKVYLQFIVEKDGSVSNVKVVKGIGGGCDEEAVRVVSNSPKWKPATQGGEPVRCKFTFPINFALN